MTQNYFSLTDLLIIPLNVFIVFALCLWLSRRYKPGDLYRYFWIGLGLRLIGGLFHFLYHRFVYQGGDTFNYYLGITEYHEAMIQHPIDWLRSLFLSGDNYPESIKQICKFEMHYATEEALTIKVGSILGIFGLNSFLSIGLWFSLFSFFGSWRMYLVFKDKYPDIGNALIIPFLLVPSCFFWGSSISKDALTLGAFGLFFHAFYFIFFKKQFKVSLFIWLLLSTYIVAMIKGYILVLFFPALLFLSYFILLNNIQQRLLKLLIIPISLLLLSFVANSSLNWLSNSDVFNQYVNDQTTESIKNQYEYLSKQTEARSSYDLGDFEPTPDGVLKVMPKAINVTLYRPYLGEINSVALLISGVESLLTILLTFWVIMKTGVLRFFKLLFSDAYLLFCLLFVLLFSSIVGITSGNFGSLMRYKIPIMPFYFIILVIIYYRRKNINNRPCIHDK